MSRPLKGSKKLTDKGWTASLPIHRGATKRQTYTFTAEEAADRWIAAGIPAIENGTDLPVPDAESRVAGKRSTKTGTAFRTMADPWHTEYYSELKRAKHDLSTATKGHIKRIEAFMNQRGLVMETMVRDEVKALQASLTRSTTEATVTIPEGVDPTGLVTMAEALELPGMASKSTLKRRKADGVLVPVDPTAAVHRFRVADLYSEAVLGPTGELRRGPRTNGSLSQDVANDVMWAYNEVCKYALDHGVDVPQDRTSLKMHRTDRAPSAPRQPVSLSRCADIASRLHVVHQLVLWLMRILGLRIGEAYGIRVYDVLDQGAGQCGAVAVKAQGGKKFTQTAPDGTTHTSDHTDDLKTRNSARVLVVPPTLMDLIRTTIAVFHTDADGVIRQDARLIPGLTRRNAGGQEAFRAALAGAAEAVRVDCTTEEDVIDEVFSCQPHDMRRTILSDLDRLEVKDSHTRRFAGHLPGTAVLHRHYLLDDPKLRPARAIAVLIEGELSANLPAGLLLPTTVRCTTGNQPALQKDGLRIDAELAELGWLVLMTNEGGEPLLGSAEAAQLWDVTPKTARLWMAEGRIPSIPCGGRGTGQERRVRLSDAMSLRERLRAQITLVRLAEEVETTYHTVYQLVRAKGLELEAWGERDYIVPPATTTVLREHYAHQAELHRRAVPYSVAAKELGTTVAAVEHRVKDGMLDQDERAHDGRRMVTRKSLAEATQQPVRRRTPKVRDDLMTWAEVSAATGLAGADIDALVADGLLVRVQHQRRRHVTRVSVLRYLVEHDPSRLALAV
ncbi:helix-turn-helix domain-containing protein [Nocardioides nanhaiensis]|uniref:Tyr recombinase domain-containing protein n=1 Tax=Nocardioides nanhaiensis TaxID=1476871 RepID=A0ABP8W314_9ACTN